MRTTHVIAFFCVASACQSTSHGDAPNGGDGNGNPPPPAPPSGGGENVGGSSSAGSTGDDSNEPTVPYVKFDLNHILSTGQSNSVAHGGVPPMSLTQPYHNVMFDTGVMTALGCEKQGCREYQKPTALVPLVEGDSFFYPVETMSSALGNQITKLATEKYGEQSHDVLVSLAGRNGLTYWCLRKGTCNYVDPAYIPSFDETLMQARDGKALAAAAGKSYVVRAITVIHGESDDAGYAYDTPEFPLDGTDGVHDELASYADALIEWQRDLEAGVKAITGQTQDIPLLYSQHSGWNDIATSAVAQMQYEAHARSTGKIFLIGPGYPLDYAVDCRHYSSDGERRLGEYFAKVYARVVIEGKRWEPVRPRDVSIAGATITAHYYVPVPPLVIDTDRVVDPGNAGFAVVDAAGNDVPIAGVAVTAPDVVTVTLAAPPASDVKLRYAFSHEPHTCIGRFVGARGNLRDSDTTPSQAGYELFNWGVHYEVAVHR
jgi:hypothetical protein